MAECHDSFEFFLQEMPAGLETLELLVDKSHLSTIICFNDERIGAKMTAICCDIILFILTHSIF